MRGEPFSEEYELLMQRYRKVLGENRALRRRLSKSAPRGPVFQEGVNRSNMAERVRAAIETHNDPKQRRNPSALEIIFGIDENTRIKWFEP